LYRRGVFIKKNLHRGISAMSFGGKELMKRERRKRIRCEKNEI
jgi:hypothetical protein